MRTRTDDLTVSITNGQSMTLNADNIALIASRRNTATLFRQQGNARDEALTLRDLRWDIAERLNITQAMAHTVLAGVRTGDLYVADAPQGKPDHLDLAVRWDRGWKTYEVTGTWHAYYLLRKLAGRDGFQGARLNDVLVLPDGTRKDNVIALGPDDITGPDRFGKYQALLDRNNSSYDLEKDELQH